MQLINDHMQNRKQYNIPKAQLVIADIPTTLARMHTEAIRNGILMATAQKAKANLPEKNFLTRIKTSASRSSSIFAQRW